MIPPPDTEDSTPAGDTPSRHEPLNVLCACFIPTQTPTEPQVLTPQSTSSLPQSSCPCSTHQPPKHFEPEMGQWIAHWFCQSSLAHRSLNWGDAEFTADHLRFEDSSIWGRHDGFLNTVVSRTTCILFTVVTQGVLARGSVYFLSVLHVQFCLNVL